MFCWDPRSYEMTYRVQSSMLPRVYFATPFCFFIKLRILVQSTKGSKSDLAVNNRRFTIRVAACCSGRRDRGRARSVVREDVRLRISTWWAPKSNGVEGKVVVDEALPSDSGEAALGSNT